MKAALGLPLLLVLAISGCAASEPEAAAPPATSAEPAEVDPNIGACNDFLDTFNKLAKANEDRNADDISIDAWREIVDNAGTDYDAVALVAEGDVKTRIEDLVEWIDSSPNGIRVSSLDEDLWADYKSNLDRIGQACTVAGVEMSFTAS